MTAKQFLSLRVRMVGALVALAALGAALPTSAHAINVGI